LRIGLHYRCWKESSKVDSTEGNKPNS